MCNKICGICGKEITEDELINNEVMIFYEPDSNLTEIAEYEHRECISKKYSNNLSDLLTYWS